MRRSVFAKRLFFRQDQRGATALEFAILAPLFLTLILATLQLSIAMHNGNTAKWAVKKAARDLLVDNTLTQAEIQSLVDGYLTDVGSNVSVTVTYALDTSGSLTIGNLSANYEHKIDVPFLRSFTADFPVSVSVPHAST